jgi:hypothetical protein
MARSTGTIGSTNRKVVRLPGGLRPPAGTNGPPLAPSTKKAVHAPDHLSRHYVKGAPDDVPSLYTPFRLLWYSKPCALLAELPREAKAA